ncbi:hypothetical protein LEP1GSC043_3932 [Leptospira weilii str. Ecochallenge]|uniref:Uncharacterized protein n=1 Tax=Leptospira weilii str. Ecochallenge TaxID=1049986 RepID=N1UA47_9LEPT|nr:hypothetical protein LEP1GSC043_3932 [Leptospira weilii str. Ecochallenge]
MQRRVNPLPWKEVSPMDEKVKIHCGSLRWKCFNHFVVRDVWNQ